MNLNDSSADDPSSRAEFENALVRLVRTAVGNDADIRGGYRIESDASEQEFGVEIYRVVPSDD